jgi:hypothetical protein
MEKIEPGLPSETAKSSIARIRLEVSSPPDWMVMIMFPAKMV